MTVLDGPLRGVAKTLLGQLGKTVTYRRIVAGDYDPQTSDTWPETKTTATIAVQVEDTNRLEKLGFELTGEIRTGDFGLVLAAQAFEEAFGAGLRPEGGDEVDFESKTYRVLQVKPLYSGDQVATYTLQVRR